MNLQYTSPFYMYLEALVGSKQKKSQQAALPAAQLHTLNVLPLRRLSRLVAAGGEELTWWFFRQFV